MNKTRPVYRQCVASREKLLKKDLFRLVKVENKVFIDEKQNKQGRGVYLKKDLKTIELAHKNKTLNKALRTQVGDEIYVELIQLLSKERRD